MSFARSGRRVLIIDADLRKPSFVANSKDSVGLSGLLTGDEPLDANVIGSSTEGLFLLPSGVIPPNPAELLSSPRLPALIEEAGEIFDIIIIDSPPLLGFADAPILGSVCDATIVVIESGSIRRPAAQRTIERLMESRSNVVGVVLTKFDAKKSGYESGYYYYSYGRGAYAYGSKRSNKGANNRRKIRLFDSAETSRQPLDHE
jgi:capsular exopolysaccharide synthesis family protein